MTSRKCATIRPCSKPHAVVTGRRCEQGECPPDWTKHCECAGCGPVFLWPGSPVRVFVCPWCSKRAEGCPIPRPVAHSRNTESPTATSTWAPSRFAVGTNPCEQQRRSATRRDHAHDPGPHPRMQSSTNSRRGPSTPSAWTTSIVISSLSCGRSHSAGPPGRRWRLSAPAGDGLRPPSQHRQRPIAGEQCIGYAQ